MAALARELEVVRRAGHAQHHSIEAGVVLEPAEPGEAHAGRVEPHDVVEPIGGTRDPQSRCRRHSNISTVRATSPAFIARNASFTSSSAIRAA